MKKQEYAEIEARLAAAVSDLSDRAGKQEAAGGRTADGADVREADVIKTAEELWEQPVERASEDAWYLDGTGVQQMTRANQKASAQQTVRADQKAGSVQQTTGKSRTAAGTGRRIPLRRIWSTIAAAAAVLVFVMFYHINLRTDAVVFLDVNPSVSLEINSREKVTQALACNPDGEKILAEMDLRRTDVDVAVNALIGSMIRHGYLSEVQDTLLLSIDCTNAEKKEALRQRLSGEISDELMALLGKSSVFEQDVDVDDDLEDLAEQYGITPGKAALIMKLIEKDPSLDFGKLAGMPMNVLADYLRTAGIDLRDYTRYLGDDWDDDDDSDDNDPDDDDDRDDENDRDDDDDDD